MTGNPCRVGIFPNRIWYPKNRVKLCKTYLWHTKEQHLLRRNVKVPSKYEIPGQSVLWLVTTIASKVNFLSWVKRLNLLQDCQEHLNSRTMEKLSEKGNLYHGMYFYWPRREGNVFTCVRDSVHREGWTMSHLTRLPQPWATWPDSPVRAALEWSASLEWDFNLPDQLVSATCIPLSPQYQSCWI